MTAPHDLSLTFWEHFDELRKTLLQMLAIIAIGTLTALLFYAQILHFMTAPLTSHSQALTSAPIIHTRVSNQGSENHAYTVIEPAEVVTAVKAKVQTKESYLIEPGGFLEIKQVQPHPLVLLSPIEGLMMVIKTCCWVSLLATSPLWLFLFLRFIAPALGHHERLLILPFITLSTLFSFGGALFAYTITIPLSNTYLNTFNATIGVNLWSFTHYLNYTWLLILANSISFEFFVILLFLVHYGLISAEGMRRYWKGVCVAIFILSALLTPPDVLTQVLLAFPLLGLYEVAILYAKIRQKKSAKKNLTLDYLE